ncbi:MAG TPA: DUF1998 domain-containing protein [Puia sp.]|nr:DUF1998 domain-containing protein [Puia sp.]
MAKKIDRSIRLSQVISNYGIGALYDILGESLVLTDTRRWLESSHYGKGREIKAERLLESLRSMPGYFNVSGLHEPAKEGSGSLPFMRFPRWLFCSTCRRMKQWTFDDEVEGESPVCPFCDRKPKLTPMRFITICEEGHMSDVDWARWAHSHQNAEHQKTCQSKRLEFITGHSKSGGLGSIAVKCLDCGAGRSLEGITAPDVLKSVGARCSGKQPWQRGDNAVQCGNRIYVVQRGAGNVYYPQISSALTIPPESRYREGEPVDRKKVIMDHPLARYLSDREHKEFFETVVKSIAKEVGCSVEEVIRIADSRNQEAEASVTAQSIETEEWNALITEIAEAHDQDKFVTRHVDISEGSTLPELTSCIDKLVSVIKLREVRALTGFFRYHPGGTEESGSTSAIRPDLDGSLTWLPAVEVFGEGIFLTLNEPDLQQWERLPALRQRVAVIAGRTGNSSLEYLLPDVTPRYILLHTLSHILIRRLAFECGYSSASLRERIYSAAPGGGRGVKAGILIYTAAGDSEGTLGGLARQAESKRFRETLLSALQDAANCSADPICMESKGQGLDTLNLAACHACVLVSETSCTSFNLILDRAMVIGGAGVPGYFQKLLEAALASTIKVSIEK